MHVLNGSIEPVVRPILERQFAEGKSPVFVHKTARTSI